MTRTRTDRLHRAAVLVFMVAITTCLLAMAFGQAGRGIAAAPGILVYAFAAGFGLEFIGSAWTGRWRSPRGRRQLQS